MLTLPLSSRRRTWKRAAAAGALTALLWPLASVTWAALPPATSPQPGTASTGVGARATLAWTQGQLDLIQNGGFEQGLTGWTVQTQGFQAGAIVNNGTQNPAGNDGPTPPLEGNNSVYLEQGFFGDSQVVLFQEVTIPTNTSRATLRWSHRIRSYGEFIFGANDVHGFVVQIVDSAAGQSLLLPFITEPGDPLLQDWTKRSVDLSPYAGRRLLIAFIAIMTNGDMTVHLDRISLVVDSPQGINSSVLMSTNNIVTVSDSLGTTQGQQWTVETLLPNTTYYWRIYNTFGADQVLGPTWSFTTAAAGALDHFGWSPLPDTVTGGSSVPVTLTALDAHGFRVNNFSGSAQLGLSHLDFSSPAPHLLGDEPFTALSEYENTTLGYAFTPTSDLWVTHFRTFAGDNVSLWTSNGDLLARKNLAVPAGSWIDTPLDQPVFLAAGRSYRLSVFARDLQTQYLRFDAPVTFAHGTIDQSYFNQGNGFPNSTHPAQWFFVDLAYQVHGGAGTESVQPAATESFVNGVWSGQLTLPNVDAPWAALSATTTDASVIPFSSPFALVSIADDDGDGLPNDWEEANDLDPDDPSDADEDFDMDGASNRDEYLAGTDPNDDASVLAITFIGVEGNDVVLRFPTVIGGTYRLDKASPLDPMNWMPWGAPMAGDDTQQEVRDADAATTGSAFYRLSVTRP